MEGLAVPRRTANSRPVPEDPATVSWELLHGPGSTPTMGNEAAIAGILTRAVSAKGYTDPH